ncbi:putative peptide zinc metalloprotease protein [Nitrosomonas sp. Nm84]|uniref:HlyD family efflux transporter periplasmic adaptor subunit n=1 Tax=Nitrosomonas sp. Nm84 TaxID=200124 RepID=UPI000D756ED3|nr:HlyD family efflux transporter periplasmic adaptor subunit [Nitrosomonas sp. Nm84]PXW89760.1 putative peptide zinc metalloprotease protein [Nitrosomonas sp. Nm84]
MSSSNIQPLPSLRSDLHFLKAPNAHDGSATWTLYDPVNNRFYRISILIHHMLSRWSINNGQQIIDQIANETVFKPTQEDIATLINFLQRNQLTNQSHAQPASEYLAQHRKADTNLWKKIAHQYLFFRIPLFQPDAFLNRTYPFVKQLFSATFLSFAILIGIAGLYLVSRQWDVFANTFLHFFSLQGILVYAIALIGVKTIHELGHMYTAKHYGCRVPSMGLAFMVMVPMIYSDMSDTWRLYSKKQRIHVAAAGILNELLMAGICLFIWAFLPEGILRSVCFVIATTSLISSLLINITPFMRFDGYYILSDWWGIDNLQQRSFLLAKWKLRQLLFGSVEEKPEHFSPEIEFKLIGYAWFTWFYRLILFIGIALLVYHLFFKLLGIILFVVEIVALILVPLFKEVRYWWMLRNSIQLNNRLRIWMLILISSISLLFIPWNSHIYIPGVLTSANYSKIFTPESAQIVSIEIQSGQKVDKDQVLIVLKSQKLDVEIELTRKRLELLELRATRAVVSRQEQDNLQVILEEIASESSKLEGLERQQEKLSLRAPFSGVITEMDETLHVSGWVKSATPLFSIMDSNTSEIRGVVSEYELNRIELGQQASFYPEDIQLPKLTASIDRIDKSEIRNLDLTYLISNYGGSVATRSSKNGTFVPETTIYAVYLGNVSSSVPQKEIKGNIFISGTPISLATRVYEMITSVFIRESGF